MEDEAGAGKNQKNECYEFGYQNFESRNGWERQLSPPETLFDTFVLK
jgi:hypothetical protein